MSMYVHTYVLCPSGSFSVRYLIEAMYEYENKNELKPQRFWGEVVLRALSSRGLLLLYVGARTVYLVYTTVPSYGGIITD